LLISLVSNFYSVWSVITARCRIFRLARVNIERGWRESILGAQGFQPTSQPTNPGPTKPPSPPVHGITCPLPTWLGPPSTPSAPSLFQNTPPSPHAPHHSLSLSPGGIAPPSVGHSGVAPPPAASHCGGVAPPPAASTASTPPPPPSLAA
jgi:hypothetical protein